MRQMGMVGMLEVVVRSLGVEGHRSCHRFVFSKNKFPGSISPTSTSVELSAPTVVPELSFSFTLVELKDMSAGTSLTSVTVIVRV